MTKVPTVLSLPGVDRSSVVTAPQDRLVPAPRPRAAKGPYPFPPTSQRHGHRQTGAPPPGPITASSSATASRVSLRRTPACPRGRRSRRPPARRVRRTALSHSRFRQLHAHLGDKARLPRLSSLQLIWRMASRDPRRELASSRSLKEKERSAANAIVPRASSPIAPVAAGLRACLLQRTPRVVRWARPTRGRMNWSRTAAHHGCLLDSARKWAGSTSIEQRGVAQRHALTAARLGLRNGPLSRALRALLRDDECAMAR